MSGATPPPEQPEYLELGRTPREHKPRRGLGTGIVVAIVVALMVPLGAFAAFRLLGGGGTQPHDVLPANAIGYFRIDVDPSAPEKIDAMRFLRTFPAFEKYTRIDDDRADIRKVVFDAMLDHTPCQADYEDDVAPWLGERLGVAVTPPAGSAAEPGFAVAVQVSDEQAASRGLDKLRACDAGNSPAGGWTYLDGYMIVSETQRKAEALAAAAEQRPLADDEQFRSDMDRLGDQGVASLWFSGEGIYRAFATDEALGPMDDQLRRQVDQSYRSGAVAFRFDDRYVELATVLTGSAYQESDDGAIADMALPETTAVALGFADGGGYVDEQWDMMLGGDPGMGKEIERELGLELPADLRTVFGESFTLALDGKDLDLGALGSAGPSALDLGVRVSTDPAELTRIVQRLEAKARQSGFPLDLVVERSDAGVVAALNRAYASELTETGSLADTDAFQTAVPDADEAQAVFFVDFDALEKPALEMMRQAGATGAAPGELEANLTKIEAFGASGSNHDGYAEGAFRITVAD
ncbi:MAG TPA: DUF3352 domain-containing protein [Nocardioidaceae bacterium]|nr:DUF3352 domain-containing protein [Nocardioidaceae bacterium]